MFVDSPYCFREQTTPQKSPQLGGESGDFDSTSAANISPVQTRKKGNFTSMQYLPFTYYNEYQNKCFLCIIHVLQESEHYILSDIFENC